MIGEENCYFSAGGHSDMGIFNNDSGYFTAINGEDVEFGIER